MRHKKLMLLLIGGILMSIFNFSSWAGETYQSKWKEVEDFENKNLPKSSLKVVEDIYKRAGEEKNDTEYIKALLYKLKYSVWLEESSQEKAIYSLKEHAEKAEFPIKNILYSMLAEKYWNYYQQNRYKFLNRTETINFKNDDVATWNLDQIVSESFKIYQLSLVKSDKLKEIKLDNFDPILFKGNGRDLRPTLFDFLAYRVIEFDSNSEAGLHEAANKYVIDGKEYFDIGEKFAAKKFTNIDEASLKYNGIKIFQELTKFHLKEREPLIGVELARLKYVLNNSVEENKEEMYENALLKLLREHDNSFMVSEIAYEVAKLYVSKGTKFANDKNEDNRYYFKKALDFYNAYKNRTQNNDYGKRNLEFIREQVMTKRLEVTLEKAVLPNKLFPAKITFRNIDKAYIRIVKVNVDEFADDYYDNRDKMLNKYISKRAEKEWNVTLPDSGDYQPHSVEIKCDGMPEGTYITLVSPASDFSYTSGIAYTLFTSTNISYLQRFSSGKGMECTVLNRETGEPLKNISANLFMTNYDYNKRRYVNTRLNNSYKSDEFGYFSDKTLSNSNNQFIEFTNGKDKFRTDAFYYYQPYDNTNEQMVTYLFTDRAIYRPGQTIYYKGLMTKGDGKKSEVIPNYPATVIFYDVNYLKVAEKTLTTNEFGTFNGSFTVPQNVITGTMRIQSPYGVKEIRVEEYKRPKFDVDFKPIDKSYRVNEKIKVTGFAKAYSGVNIDGAKVRYRVQRTVQYPYYYYWWFPYFRTQEVEVANGYTTTNEKGEFVVEFDAVPDPKSHEKDDPKFTYLVTADVTDTNGETRTGTQYVRAGYRVLELTTNIAQMINKAEDKPVISISTLNLNGGFEAAKGNIKIYSLKDDKRIKRDKLWEKADSYLYKQEEYTKYFPNDKYKDEGELYNLEKQNEVFDADFDTNKEKNMALKNLKELKVGRYKLEAVAKDKYGKDVNYSSFFTVYSTAEKELPYTTPNWFSVTNTTVEPGNNVRIILGSSEENIKVIYELEHDGNVKDKQIINISNEQKVIEIPVKEEYRGNFVLHYTFVRDNRVYNNSTLIYVPRTDKNLSIKFETFRDKLLPGQKEEWRLKISGKDGERVTAEMVAALYDSSLDAFAQNYWYANPYYSYYTKLNWNSNSFFNASQSQLYADWRVYYYEVYRSYDRLNWFGTDSFYNYGAYARKSKRAALADGIVMQKSMSVVAESAPAPAAEIREEAAALGGSADKMDSPKNGALKKERAENEVANVNKPEAKDNDKMADIKARSNLNETAFFYPELRTNKEGELVISFTIPESLTSWRMMGYAHTKDMKFGFTEKSIVTQKDLMVIPNLPRFMREGDKIVLTAKVANMADKLLKGKAKLAIFDAETMKPIDDEFSKEVMIKDFSVNKGESAPVQWNLSIPAGKSTIICRITAQAGEFTDGEEQMVPVLTNRMLVTESMLLPVREKQTKEFKFEKLMKSDKSPTLTNYSYTFEFTPNPAWYAVQALPYMMEYPYECSEQTFSRFYANSIATYIVNSNPKIKRVFDAWKNTPDSKALLSNLEKNQELKSLLLQETPWVMQAKNEEERKRRIAVLFDLNKMTLELESAKKKLIDNQTVNGGWPWFKGMPESWYISQHIITGFGHIQKMGIPINEARVQEMLRKGVGFIDEEIVKSYENLKKYGVKLNQDNLGYMEIHYLYARSFFKSIPFKGNAKKVHEYYLGQAKDYWSNKSRYSQGMIALALYRNDVKELAKDIVKSIKEYSINNEEMGMYWKENSYGYYWYQAPIETQALLIEAFDTITPDDSDSIEGMKTWLLKQKQVQDWKTTKATAEACYALLIRGTKILDESNMPDIKLGGKELDTSNIKKEEGTGYFKVTWNKEEVKPEMGDIKIKNNNNVTAWGAAYWQYFENLDKITFAETPLKVKKELFIEKLTAKGVVLDLVSEKTKIKIGDRVKVRIEIRVDRNMEYVHMKDMRASAFEPENVLSVYKYQDGLGYYEATKDTATNFFFDYLPKGTYVFEYPLRATNEGDFSNGITTIQSMYAPEFTSHTAGIRVKIEK